MKTKTIDIEAKEWFDKINGNSYFCGTITLNYLMDNQETFLMPFQYGYGSQYEDEAKAILTQFNKISSNWFQGLYTYCKDNNIILRSSIKRKSLKRELKQIENNYWQLNQESLIKHYGYINMKIIGIIRKPNKKKSD